MPIVDDSGFRADAWTRIGADDAVPADAEAVIVPLDRVLAGDGLSTARRLGVDLANDIDPAVLVPVLPRLSLIAVAFPAFADGRGFSLARRLRRLGYARTLRATGHLIADQYAFARAAGFDEVEIGDDQARRQPEEQWTRAAAAISLSYQRGFDGPRNILEARRGAV
jgi:uncharacterized protein (DUF934 family)